VRWLEDFSKRERPENFAGAGGSGAGGSGWELAPVAPGGADRTIRLHESHATIAITSAHQITASLFVMRHISTARRTGGARETKRSKIPRAPRRLRAAPETNDRPQAVGRCLGRDTFPLVPPRGA
jgi:hypothetical protein